MLACLLAAAPSCPKIWLRDPAALKSDYSFYNNGLTCDFPRTRSQIAMPYSSNLIDSVQITDIAMNFPIFDQAQLEAFKTACSQRLQFQYAQKPKIAWLKQFVKELQAQLIEQQTLYEQSTDINNQFYFQKNILPYPAPTCITWNTHGQLAIIKNGGMFRIINQNQNFKVINEKNMDELLNFVQKKKQNNEKSAQKQKLGLLIHDPDEDDCNQYQFPIDVIDDPDSDDNDYLNFKFIPQFNTEIDEYADVKKNIVATTSN